MRRHRMQVLTAVVGRGLSTCGFVFFLLTSLSAGSADPTSGWELFETNCAVCHGMDGSPNLPNAPRFSQGERMEKTDAQLLTSLSEGLNVMPPWKGVLNDQEMRELLTYVRSLAR